MTCKIQYNSLDCDLQPLYCQKISDGLDEMWTRNTCIIEQVFYYVNHLWMGVTKNPKTENNFVTRKLFCHLKSSEKLILFLDHRWVSHWFLKS